MNLAWMLVGCPHPAARPSPTVRFSDVTAVDLAAVEDVGSAGDRTFAFADGDLVALTREGTVAWRFPALDAEHVRFSSDGANVVVASLVGCVSRVDAATGEAVPHERTVNPSGWDIDASGLVSWSTTSFVPQLVGRRFDGQPDVEAPISSDELQGEVWVDGDLALVVGSKDLVVRALPSGAEVARAVTGKPRIYRFSDDLVGWEVGRRQGALDARTLQAVAVDAPCGPDAPEWTDIDGGWILPSPDGSAWAWADGRLRRVSRTDRPVASFPGSDRSLDTVASTWSLDGLRFEAPDRGAVTVSRKDRGETGEALWPLAAIRQRGWLRAVDLRTAAVVDRLRVEGHGILYEATWSPDLGWTLRLDGEVWTVGLRPPTPGPRRDPSSTRDVREP